MLQFNKKVVIFVKIQEELFHYFENAGTKVTYHPQDLIYMQEDDAQSLYLITKGRVRVYLLTATGEEITLEILDKGRIFGESSFFQNGLRPTTVTAITDVELISCRLDDLYPYLCTSKELTVSLLQLMSQTCDYVTSLLKKSYIYNRQEKVASFLLEQTSQDYPEKGIINNIIPYSHEEIALLIGLSRVTVTKVLNEFAKKGYINIAYKKIHVVNKKEISLLLQKNSQKKM